MKKNFKTIWQAIFFLSVISMTSEIHSIDAHLSMIYTNALGEKLPFEIFEKGNWKPANNARYVKLHMYFDEPITVKKYEIDTCKKLSSNVSVFLNFDEWIFNLASNEQGYQYENYPTYKDGVYSRTEFLDSSKKYPQVRSMTINFNSSTNFSICGIRIYNENDEAYHVITPHRVKAQVKATSTLKPDKAYGVVNLFDSRFEYGWASDAKPKDVQIDIDFQTEQDVQKIRIWNGYQRSVKHCYENSRVKTLILKGDKDYSVEVQAADQLGSQVINLPKPYHGKKLTVYVKDAYIGKTYKDLVISEIRFFNGQNWFLLDPYEELISQIHDMQQTFEKSGFKDVLNQGFAASKNGDKADDNTYSYSSIRLRADGSFYLDGSVNDYSKAMGKYYFSLGNFDVIEKKQNQLRMRLFGLLYQTENELHMDCNGCGRDCNTSDTDSNQKYMIFQEFVTLTPDGKGGFNVINESGGKKLPFKMLNFAEQKGN
ncbi:MAG: hypothetical protein OEV78_08965 [Spirochaetia bacterium]|nr:hypothetical protein [Spirochaetia bacterium]